MSKKQTQSLKNLIRRSRLLSEDRKEALLRVLESLDRKQLKEIAKIFEAEDKMILDSAKEVIETSINNNNIDSIEDLSEFLNTSEQTLRKEEEKAERAQEGQDTESMFSNSL